MTVAVDGKNGSGGSGGSGRNKDGGSQGYEYRGGSRGRGNTMVAGDSGKLVAQRLKEVAVA